MTAARREPLIWLQLVGLAALPLELLLLLLLLAGSDPGGLPALERLLAWAIGALAPAVLLWRRPADPFSLLLVQVPLRARSTAQRTLLAAPTLAARLAGVMAGAVLLPVLWWIDARAALAGPVAPLADANRMLALLLTTPVLALMVWQLQQVLQAAALLYLPDEGLRGLTPLTQEQIEQQRLSLGLPLLLLEPLLNNAPPAPLEDRSPIEPAAVEDPPEPAEPAGQAEPAQATEPPEPTEAECPAPAAESTGAHPQPPAEIPGESDPADEPGQAET
ncbi:low-complexity tail membrane protein [Cyanobium sp. CH-040]|uniref:low-complexity tail membrane protein n=1 Tax=Cyanobium sp. CH-040 TaxID=2823708 RepID=UPI0020CBA07A|nr:low-complexity tail membrane protein [Cyanobium sp. CH-040]MCP9927952.1 low-complexity tail membrane protein [Cyanobium sp. CH-040]